MFGLDHYLNRGLLCGQKLNLLQDKGQGQAFQHCNCRDVFGSSLFHVGSPKANLPAIRYAMAMRFSSDR